MRRFLLLAHKVPPGGEFSLNDLAGSGGRMDEVAAVVTAAFLVSNGLRRETELRLLLVGDPTRPRRIRMEGKRLKFLNPDERSTAALLKNALGRGGPRPEVEMETTPGIFVGPCEPASEIRAFLGPPGGLWATEEGTPLRDVALGSGAAGPEGEVSVVLSDPWDPTPAERELLLATGVPRVAVGPRSLRASHVVVLLHNELDLRESAAGAQGARAPAPTGGSPAPGSGA